MKLLNKAKYIKKELKENRFLNSYSISEAGSAFYYDFIESQTPLKPNILKVTGIASSLSYEEQIKIIESHWEKTIEEVINLREIMDALEIEELPMEYNFETPEYLLEYEGVPSEFIETIKTKKLKKEHK